MPAHLHSGLPFRVVYLLCAWGSLLGAGCGQRTSTRAPVAAPLPVRVLNWDDYIDPAVLTNFTLRTGIPVEYNTYSTQDELTGAVRSDPGRYDLIVVDDSVIEMLQELRLLRPMEPERIKGLENLGTRWRRHPTDPDSRYSIPYLWGTTLLAYRKDRLTEPPTDWSVLWDARYRGRIMMLADFQENIGLALLSLGNSINSGVATQLSRAQERLCRQASLVQSYASGTDIKQALLSGSTWVAPLYSGDAAMAAEASDQVDYVLPTGGAPIWIDRFAMPRDSRNPDGARAFIEYLLIPEIAAQNAEYLCYATPNEAALPLLSKELLADTRLFPPREVLDRCEFYSKPDAARLRIYNTTAAEVRRLTKNPPEAGPPAMP